jgi:single-stranded-DNA-specific exonuclease
VAGDGWHRGVIGIVASKLVDAFHRPAIVLSVEDDMAHGSCRSIGAFDMLAALERCATHMIRFGGHRQAAGFMMEAARVKAFRADITAYADGMLEPDDLKPRLRIDARLGFRDITGDVAGHVTMLAPFGIGNPRPVFEASGVEVVDGPRRLKEKHLKMALRHDGRVVRAVAWRAAEREQFIHEHRSGLDLAFSLEQNSYKGDVFLEISVADVKESRRP